MTAISAVAYAQIRRRTAQRRADCAYGHVAFAVEDRDGLKFWACRNCRAYANFGTGQAWRYHP